MIIASLIGPTAADVRRQVRVASRFADLFEVRLDLIRKRYRAAAMRAPSRPWIATCRTAAEGGKHRGTVEERARVLRSAIDAGAAYVDVELREFHAIAARLRIPPGVGTIVSLHDFTSASPPAPAKIYRRLRATGATVVKYAYPARDASDVDRCRIFLKHAREDRQRAIAVALGEAGEASRVLYRVWGGWGMFAAAEPGAAAAPGQITVRELRTVYRAHRLTPSTRVYGVIGMPVSQSKGVYVHNALFGTRSRVYTRFAVSDLRRFMRTVALWLSGFSVTLPHKEAVMRSLDEIEPRARAIGAVNTVIRTEKGLSGFNTDAPAAIDAIEKHGSVRGRTVVIIGYGGSARAIAFEAARRGGMVVVVGRNEHRARALARAIGVRYAALDELPALRPDILVNATPVGMVPHVHRAPVQLAGIRPDIVMDAVYNPPVTALLKAARRTGATIVSGTEMYLRQGALQSLMFTGKKPDLKKMRRILARVLS